MLHKLGSTAVVVEIRCGISGSGQMFVGTKNLDKCGRFLHPIYRLGTVNV